MPLSQNKLGRYEIIREIARSNDIVYEAFDPQFNRKVAVKVLNLAQVAEPAERNDRIARFEREARAVGSLDHPSIMRVYDAGCEGGDHYLVMELIEGVSLQGELERRGRLDLTSAVMILAQILDALGYAHSRGVIHRDLKPANIQCLPGGIVKLMDFGIARLVYETAMTQTGAALGTLHYMSPEQIRGEHVDARSDLFSVGSIAYVLLTGNFPFPGSDVASICMGILQRDPVMPPAFSPEVTAFLERSLAKDPLARFQSAPEMLAALQSVSNPTMRSSQYVGRAVVAAPRPPAPSAPPRTPPVAQDAQNAAAPLASWPPNDFLLKALGVMALTALLLPFTRLALFGLGLVLAALLYAFSTGMRRSLSAAVGAVCALALVWQWATTSALAGVPRPWAPSATVAAGSGPSTAPKAGPAPTASSAKSQRHYPAGGDVVQGHPSSGSGKVGAKGGGKHPGATVQAPHQTSTPNVGTPETPAAPPSGQRVPITSVEAVSFGGLARGGQKDSSGNSMFFSDYIYVNDGGLGRQPGFALFDLGSKWKSFEGYVGVSDSSGPGWEGEYAFMVDGSVVKSGTMKTGEAPVHIELDLSGAKAFRYELKGWCRLYDAHLTN